MRWQGRKESSNIEDRRGSGGGNFGGGRGTGVLGIIILLVGAYYGVDLSGLVGHTGFFWTKLSTIRNPRRTAACESF